MVAMDVGELDHKPPAGVPVSVDAMPGQTSTDPVITGNGYTVTMLTAAQPDGNT